MTGEKYAEKSHVPAGNVEVARKSRFRRLLELDWAAVERRRGCVLPIVRAELRELIDRGTRRDCKKAAELAEKYAPYAEDLQLLKEEAEYGKRFRLSGFFDGLKLAAGFGLVFAGLGGVAGAAVKAGLRLLERLASAPEIKSAVSDGYEIGAWAGMAVYAMLAAAYGVFCLAANMKERREAKRGGD